MRNLHVDGGGKLIEHDSMRVLHLVLDGESCGVRGVAHGQEQLDTSRKRLDEGGDSLDDLLKLGLKDLVLLQEV